MKRVVTSIATGAVYKWGIDVDFTGTFDPVKYQQVDLLDTATFIAGLPKYYHKVVAGLLVEMTVGKKAAVDVERETIQQENMNSTATVTVNFPTVASLPIPPPEKGYIVTVASIGGNRGLAMSTPTGWVLFQQSGEVP